MKGVAPELAVGERPFLECPQGFDTLVRLPQQAEPEDADSDHEQRRAHEGDEQLEVNPRRQTGNRPDERVVCETQQPPLVCPAALSCGMSPSRPRSDDQLGGTSHHSGDQPATVDPRDIEVASGNGRHLSRVDVDEVALEVQRAPVSVDRDLELVGRVIRNPVRRRA